MGLYNWLGFQAFGVQVVQRNQLQEVENFRFSLR